MAKVQSKIFIFVYLLMMVGYCWGRYLRDDDYCGGLVRGFYFENIKNYHQERHNWDRDVELLCNYSKEGYGWVKRLMCNHYPNVDRKKHILCIDFMLMLDECYDIDYIEC